MGARGQAIVAGVQAGISTAKEWWASLSAEEQASYRSLGISSAQGWAMARRCKKGRPRASDICNGAIAANGNGNGNGNGTNVLTRTREERAALRAQRAEERRTARQVTGPGLAATMPRINPGQVGLTPGNGAAANGEQLWYQNPLVWAAGAAGAYLLWMRK